MLKTCLKRLGILMIVFVNFGFDQVSKSYVRAHIEYLSVTEVVPDILTITRVENPGAMVGLGANLGPVMKTIVLKVIPLMILVASAFFLLIKTSLPSYLVIGLAMTIGGGLGNLLDRFLYGSVTDFMHLQLGVFETAIFNIADVSVMIGLLIVMAGTYLNKNEQLGL